MTPSRKPGFWLKIWLYFVEVLVAAVICIAIWRWVGDDAVHGFIRTTATQWIILHSVLFSAALAIWLTYVNFRRTEFGDYLHFRNGLDITYNRVFSTPIAIYLVTLLNLILVVGIDRKWATRLALFSITVSLVNVLSMIANASNLIRDYGAFSDGIKAERARMEMEPDRNHPMVDPDE